MPAVEDVQDIVEDVLLTSGYIEVAKAYAAYRSRHTELRKIREYLESRKDLKLSLNSLKVLQKRYLKKNEAGEIVETPQQMFKRVAKAIALGDKKFGNVKEAEKKFYEMLSKLDFLPNSPTLMNAGAEKQMLSACFVLPVEDSLESIFTTLKNTALIEQVGGGVGFSFTKLRPYGDIVGSTNGVSSGPVSFMKVFDATTEVIKQGSRRRGAMMGILNVDHPDILNFITSKTTEGALRNFNISVGVNEKFMDAAKKNKEYSLINPRNKKAVKKQNAKDVFDLITRMAWQTGDPGIVFLDEINKMQPTPKLGKIESTNPCGEVDLLPYESCNLGSINLTKFFEEGQINWERLRETVHLAVHFLDNVIEVNDFPLKETEKITKGNRKIGLGVMGWADLLILLETPYDSEEALKLAEKLIKFIREEAEKASENLAKKRGVFPNFKKSKLKRKLRNATVLSIAPTGTISIIAGSSSTGIEPLFAVAFVREVMEGTKLLEVHPLFEKIAKEKGFYSKELMDKIATKGSVQGIKEVPQDVQKLFVTALDIKPEWHLKMQAAFQKYVDNAVSKTVNTPTNSTIEDVKNIYLLAHKLKCKGVTIFRYGCKKEQVLYRVKDKLEAKAEYSGGCPTGECVF